MRGRNLSRETLREQIAEDGEEFGIIAMDTVYGDVIAGEILLTVLPLAAGVNYIEEVQRDICSVSQSYPMSAVIRSRKHKNERTFAHRTEIREMAQRRGSELRKESMYHELGGDIRRADRGRVTVRVR